jgi:hypothetical protein
MGNRAGNGRLRALKTGGRDPVSDRATAEKAPTYIKNRKIINNRLTFITKILISPLSSIPDESSKHTSNSAFPDPMVGGYGCALPSGGLHVLAETRGDVRPRADASLYPQGGRLVVHDRNRSSILREPRPPHLPAGFLFSCLTPFKDQEINELQITSNHVSSRVMKQK